MEKNPPLAIPLIMMNATRGPMEFESGHMTIKLIELSVSVRKRVVKDPSLSHAKPDPRRPIAEQKLKAATRPAPMADDSPSDLLYRGRKKGGTKSGNVLRTPTAKTRTNLGSLKRFHSTNWALRSGTRSFMRYAAGRPVAMIINPRMRNDQDMPTLSMSALSMKLTAVPPRPPPAYTTPFAMPRLALKYCAGMIDAVCQCVSFL